MKLISWNVNGIRACLKKGFAEFFKQIDADIFCLQETKMQVSKVEETKTKEKQISLLPDKKAEKEISEILNLPIFKPYYDYWNRYAK